MEPAVSQLISIFGPGGMFIGYLIYCRKIDRQDRLDRERLDRELAKEDAAAKVMLAEAMTRLAERIKVPTL